MNVRFMLFNTYVRSQKQEFRKKTIEQYSKDLIQLQVKSEDLYKSKAGFEWEKNNKELVINGLYHEVLCVRMSGNTATIMILPDTAENKLFAGYFCEQKNTQQDHPMMLLFHFLFIEFHQHNKLNVAIVFFKYPKQYPAILAQGNETIFLKPPCGVNAT
jgi:hypothetical protein